MPENNVDMTLFEIVSAIKRLQYDFIELEKRLNQFVEKVTGLFFEKSQQIDKKLKEISTIQSAPIKDMLKLKALGVPTKDLLRRYGFNIDAEEKKP